MTFNCIKDIVPLFSSENLLSRVLLKTSTWWQCLQKITLTGYWAFKLRDHKYQSCIQVLYTPTPCMGNLSYLLRDKLKHMFSVEITRSRNVFHLKGFLRVTVKEYMMGQIILSEELYTPPFQTTANTDGYEKLHIVHHEQMDPLKIDIKCVWFSIIKRHIILVHEPVMIGIVDRIWWVAPIETLHMVITLK